MSSVEQRSLSRAGPAPQLPPAPVALAPTLGEVVARIGAEVSAPLTAALERVVTLASTGRIDRHGLQALRAEIDGARRVGLRGQQIARLAGGGLRQTVERLDIARCLREVLRGHAVHGNGSAVAVPPPPTRTEVLGDASLLHAALDAAAEWSASLARANVDWRIDVRPWPVRARVSCRFARLAPDQAAALPAAVTPAAGREDTLDWLLLSYCAHIAGVVVQRQDSPSHTLVSLEFLNTVNGTLEGAAAVDLVVSSEMRTQSIAGCQVLVLASQRAARQRLREAVHSQDLQLDYVSTVDDARHYCSDGAPQVLVYESAFNGAALTSLRKDLGGLAPGLVQIELLPAGQDCVMSTPAHPVTRLGLEAVPTMLLPVLLLELARGPQA